MRRSVILSLVSAGLLGGCTSLQTVPDNFRTENRGEALQGFPYSLPMRQFELAATWTLSDCANRPLDPAKPGDEPRTTIKPGLDAEPLLTAGERYLVDYRALGGWLKTSDFAMENHPDGTLKSINAAADDRTAEVAVNVAKAGFSLATLGAGSGSAALDQLLQQTSQLVDKSNVLSGIDFTMQVECSRDALKGLEAVNEAEGAVKRVTAELAETNRRVEELALAGMLDPAKRTALAAQLEAMRKKSGELDDAKEELADALKPLQVTRKVLWPGDFSEGGVDAAPLVPESLPASWTGLFVDGGPSPKPGSSDCLLALKGTLADCIAERTVTFVRLQPRFSLAEECQDKPGAFACAEALVTKPPTALGQDYTPEQRRAYRADVALYKLTNPVQARDRTPDEGIFVRPPELARLVACRDEPNCDPGSEKVIKVGDWLSVPQLGQLRFLPFRNRAFENNALVLVLGKDGTVEKFQYASKAAMLERLSSATTSFGEAALAGRKSYRDERAARRAEQLADLNHRVALDEARDKVAALDAPTAEVVEEAEQVQRISLKLELEVEDSAIAHIQAD